MKKLSLWLNIVLIIAVAGIYFLHFTGNKTEKATVESQGTEQKIDRDYAIAYVNIDTLVAHYNFFIDKTDELNKKKDESEAELQLKSNNFQKQVKDFQDQVNKGLITRTKAQMLQQELGQKEQDLYSRRDNLAQELSEQQQVMYRQGLDKIMKYLEQYNKDHNYKYIFSNSFGGQLLYVDKSLNITNEVLEGLNEEYDKKAK